MSPLLLKVLKSYDLEDEKIIKEFKDIVTKSNLLKFNQNLWYYVKLSNE